MEATAAPREDTEVSHHAAFPAPAARAREGAACGCRRLHGAAQRGGGGSEARRTREKRQQAQEQRRIGERQTPPLVPHYRTMNHRTRHTLRAALVRVGEGEALLFFHFFLEAPSDHGDGSGCESHCDSNNHKRGRRGLRGCGIVLLALPPPGPDDIRGAAQSTGRARRGSARPIPPAQRVTTPALCRPSRDPPASRPTTGRFAPGG